MAPARGRAKTEAPGPVGPTPGQPRAGLRWSRLAFVAAGVALLGAVGGALSAASGGDAAPRPHVPAAPTRSAEALAAASTTAFQRDTTEAAAAFLASLARLQRDIGAGDLRSARADELAAQGRYDRIAQVDGANPVNAASLDELASEVAPGTTFAGLHAVERSLWGPSGTEGAARYLPSLTAQAQVAAHLVSRVALVPEAIGTSAVDQLTWVVDVAIPGREEQYSHRDSVDITAGVGVVADEFAAIEPLARQTDPVLTIAVAGRLSVLVEDVAALGGPGRSPDSAMSATERIDLTRRADSAAALLAQLSARLVRFGIPAQPS